jgi:aerobic-type carbon monoxide dehydrogenase small subunit (CoxS/CutS family)
MANYTLRVNGSARDVSVDPDTPLLYVLRNDALANATGKRLRDLPFTPGEVRTALA